MVGLLPRGVGVVRVAIAGGRIVYTSNRLSDEETRIGRAMAYAIAHDDHKAIVVLSESEILRGVSEAEAA